MANLCHWVAVLVGAFLSLGVAVPISCALSVTEPLREGGLDLGGVVDGLNAGCTAGDLGGCELILPSDLLTSLVENIRVIRFVIEGFCGGSPAACFCGGASGAAAPLTLRFSMLPFEPVTGRVWGEETADEGTEEFGVVLEARWASGAGVATVAMAGSGGRVR